MYVDDSSIHGKGLFAKTFIPSGTVIGVAQGEPTTTDGEHVLWIDENEAFHIQCDLRYINHSDAECVCVQHEYGIFGGDDGVFVLHFR